MVASKTTYECRRCGAEFLDNDVFEEEYHEDIRYSNKYCCCKSYFKQVWFCADDIKKELDEITDELYEYNATISLHYIGMKEKPTYEQMVMLNQALGKIIKKLRECGD